MELIFKGSPERIMKDATTWFAAMGWKLTPYDPKNYPPALPIKPQDVWETPADTDPSQRPPDAGVNRGYPPLQKPITPKNTPTPPNTDILTSLDMKEASLEDRFSENHLMPEVETGAVAPARASAATETLPADTPAGEALDYNKAREAQEALHAKTLAARPQPAPATMRRGRGRVKGSKIVNGKIVIPPEVERAVTSRQATPIQTTTEAEKLAKKVAETLAAGNGVEKTSSKPTAQGIFNNSATPEFAPVKEGQFPVRTESITTDFSTKIEALKQVTKHVNLDAARNLLNSHGYQRVSEVPPAKEEDFIKACKALVYSKIGVGPRTDTTGLIA